MDSASKIYDDAKFTDKQKFVFLSKAALSIYEVRNFKVLHVLNMFKDSRLTLREHNNACKGFGSSKHSG